MTEQNGHQEHEHNSACDGDAGFAALEATEPHFGSSALAGSAVQDSAFSEPVSSAPAISWDPAAPPVEVGGFEALNFEAPAALAEPTLTWEAPQATAPAVLDPAPAVPPHEKRVSRKPVSKKSAAEPPVSKGHAPQKWARETASDSVTAEEFPDWHPAAHGFVEESIARDNGGDYAGEFRVPELPLQAVPSDAVPSDAVPSGSREDGESPRRSLLVDPNLPAVSIDEAPVLAFTPGGAEPRPMAAGRMSRAGAASIGSGLTAEEKEEIERQAAQRDRQKKRKSSRASKNSDYKRGFRRMSAAQEEKMRSRSPYAPAFGARSDDEETRKSPTGRGSGSNLFREGSSLNEELTPAEEAFIRGIAEEEARGIGTGKRRSASAGSPKGASRARGSRPGTSQRGNASSPPESNVPSWKQKVRAARAAEETDPYTRAKTIVYNQLAYSAKTRGQLRKKLQAEGFDAELIEPLLDKFEAAKLIDDAEYAQTFVAQKSRTKKLSRAALRRELAERGVRGEEAENALAQRTDEQEREDAAELVRKKLRPGTDLSDRAEKDKVTRRLLGMLARRGYSSSVSMSVIREELAAYGAEDELW